MSDIRVALCATATAGEGCGLTFDNKTAPGLCMRCQTLDSLASEPIELAKKETWGQCIRCGVIWQRLPTTKICGTCHLQDATQSGTIESAARDAIASRSLAFQQRLKRPISANTLAQVSVQPTIPLTTAGLNNLRNVGTADSDTIKVLVEPRVDGKIDGRLGSTSRGYAPEVEMDDIIDEILATWNAIWEKRNSRSLQRTDVDLRMHGNHNIEPNTEGLTVGQFYDVHNRATTRDIYFNKLPKAAAGLKGKVLCLELWVDTSAYEDRTGEAPIGTKVKKSKRKAVDPLELEGTLSKRPRASGPVNSVFIRKPINALNMEEKTTAIKLRFAKITTPVATCDITITWPSTAPEKDAIIRDTVFRAGKTKQVFRLTMDDKEYVAKRFFEVGGGVDKVSIAENTRELQAEAVRTTQASWFLTKFFDAARSDDVEVSQGFEFTQCFLAAEVIDDDADPSPASGVTSEDIMSQWNVLTDDRPAVVWLIEPLRTVAFQRYTGTMNHPAIPGKLGATITAFVHFAYDLSENNIVFADIQGSRGRLSTGMVGTILFDIMSHSPDGDTGVGDHGRTGIQQWVNQHTCNDVCRRLGLPDIATDELHNTEED